jgi:hypothetical protein
MVEGSGMRVNAHVLTELKRLAAEREAGELEGYSADVNQLPEFFAQPYIRLTARQRGFIFGRELRLQEMKGEQG